MTLTWTKMANPSVISALYGSLKCPDFKFHLLIDYHGENPRLLADLDYYNANDDIRTHG
jgi:hypothetical protein